ncbi:MAG: S-layer family protein [Cyanobacteria bacterium P01_A01_bin.37]
MTREQITVCCKSMKRKPSVLGYSGFLKPAVASLFILAGFQSAGHAQITPDATLPNNSVVTQTGTTHGITGGSTRGSNLFHSFDEFSVPDGDTAFFNNALPIDRIITRVTGGDRSTIEGIIRANGSADLFLINPNGIVFGPNAQLNIGGSFIASTADQIEFADGSMFSASDPAASPLLTVSVPMGLQYGADPGSIVVQGTGNALQLDPDTIEIDRSQRPSGLEVNAGETLALVGAGVVLEGGNLTASGGRIELGSVAGNEQVELSGSGTAWRLNYGEVAQFQELSLTQAASIEVSETGSGDVQIQGSDIKLEDGSTILANTQGNGTGGQTLVTASDRLILTGFSSDMSTPLFPSSIFSTPETNATGTGGSIDIHAPIMRVVDGGLISVDTLGLGNAGNLTIDAPRRLVLRGGIPDLGLSGGLLADVSSVGDGGSISIETGRLLVTGGAEISTSTFGRGDSGQIDITANSVEVVSGAAFLGASSILSSVQLDASGNAGDLVINTNRLSVSGGATVLASTFGRGSAGDLNVSAESIELSGVSLGGNPSGLFAQTDDSNGRGGNITVDTGVLRISEGASISSSTFNEGDAGNLSINARDITITGSDTGSTGLFTAVNSNATGNSGNLDIQAETLQVLNGGQVVTGTRGAGNAGLMRLDVENILLSGSNRFAKSGLFASALTDTGSGGDIQVMGDRLVIENGAAIGVSNLPSDGSRVRVGQGSAGNIEIVVDEVRLLNQGTISASTVTGRSGNISLQAENLFLFGHSAIMANAQGQEPGGNLRINTGLLLAFENSDITANAENSFGGRIVINADQIFGTEFREQLTAESDITATSALGSEFNGVVEINTSDVDILPEEFSEPGIVDTDQIAAACEQRLGNEFVLTGRGGVPADPSQSLQSPIIWQDLRLTDALSALTSQNSTEYEMDVSFLNHSLGEIQELDLVETMQRERSITQRPDHLMEAGGWMRTDDGEIQLVAQIVHPGSSMSTYPTGSCRDVAHH